MGIVEKMELCRMTDITYISRKFRALSVFAAMCVVMIHSNAILTVAAPGFGTTFIQYFVTRSFTGWAVPFFFLASGFWFAIGGYVEGTVGLRTFYQSKVRSLLIPYLCWSFLGNILTLPLTVINNYLSGRYLLERSFLGKGSLGSTFDCLLAITSPEPTGNGPLWFLRCLIIIFILAPVWKWVLRKRFGIILFIGLWFIQVYWIQYKLPFLNIYNVSFFFFLGAALGRIRWSLSLSYGVFCFAGLVWGATSVAKALILAGIEIGSLDVVEKIIPISGIVFLWGLYDRINTRLPRGVLALLESETFWIYCLHPIITSWVIATCLFVFGKGDISSLMAMMCAIIFSLVVSVSSARLARKYYPRVALVLRGGR